MQPAARGAEASSPQRLTPPRRVRGHGFSGAGLRRVGMGEPGVGVALAGGQRSGRGRSLSQQDEAENKRKPTVLPKQPVLSQRLLYLRKFRRRSATLAKKKKIKISEKS